MIPVPLVLVRGVGRKGLWDSRCSQARPRPLRPQGPGLGFAARRGSVWQLWLTLQSPLPGTPQCNPAFPFTPRKRGKKTITHIFSNLHLSVSPQSCICDARPFTRSIKNISKVSVFCKWGLQNILQISLVVWTSCLQFCYVFKVALVYLIFFRVVLSLSKQYNLAISFAFPSIFRKCK